MSTVVVQQQITTLKLIKEQSKKQKRKQKQKNKNIMHEKVNTQYPIYWIPKNKRTSVRTKEKQKSTKKKNKRKKFQAVKG